MRDAAKNGSNSSAMELLLLAASGVPRSHKLQARLDEVSSDSQSVAPTARKLGMLTVTKNGCTSEHMNPFQGTSSWYYNCAPTADTLITNPHKARCRHPNPVARTVQMAIAWI